MDIVVVIAHPDDELLCAAIVAHHSRHGRIVAIVVVTDGGAGPAYYDTTLPPEKVARLRRAEMLNSAKVLGARKVEFLDFRDGTLPDDLSPVTQRIADALRRFKPKIVLTHGPDGEYGHADHKATSRCTRDAVAALDASDQPLLYY